MKGVSGVICAGNGDRGFACVGEGKWGCRGLALLVWGYWWYIFDGGGGVLGGEAGWRYRGEVR